MDRQLISDLRLTVGDRLQEWVAQHQRDGAPASREDQRHYAGAVTRDQLTLVERQRMNHGESPLPTESFNAYQTPPPPPDGHPNHQASEHKQQQHHDAHPKTHTVQPKRS